MAERLPLVCRILKALGLHGRMRVRDAGTPVPHVACRGCGRMWSQEAS